MSAEQAEQETTMKREYIWQWAGGLTCSVTAGELGCGSEVVWRIDGKLYCKAHADVVDPPVRSGATVVSLDELLATVTRLQDERDAYEQREKELRGELARKDEALREIERMSTAASSGRYDPDAVNVVARAALVNARG